MPLDIRDITKTFGDTAVLNGVSLQARDGEFLALLGPSGSGKTTLLRVLAGLEQPDSGSVGFDGEDYLRQSPRARRAGFVFQHYALFRHMTVARNVAFGLNVRPRASRPSRVQIAARVEELLALVQLSGLEDRYPAQLSGGQRQRVALARALAIEPRILLLDEPFGALDARVRRDLRVWLRGVHDRTGVTTVFVTHDQEEALDLADRVAVLRDGVLEQVGDPQTLYDRPATAFVHDFLGPSVQLPAVVAGDRLTSEDWTTTAPHGTPDGPVLLCMRPADLRRAETGLAAKVMRVAPKPGFVRVTVRMAGRDIDIDCPAEEPLAALPTGASVRLAPNRFNLLPS